MMMKTFGGWSKKRIHKSTHAAIIDHTDCVTLWFFSFWLQLKVACYVKEEVSRKTNNNTRAIWIWIFSSSSCAQAESGQQGGVSFSGSDFTVPAFLPSRLRMYSVGCTCFSMRPIDNRFFLLWFPPSLVSFKSKMVTRIKGKEIFSGDLSSGSPTSYSYIRESTTIFDKAHNDSPLTDRTLLEKKIES